MIFPIDTSHLSTVDLWVHFEQIGDKSSLGVVYVFAFQLLVILQGLGFVVVSQVGTV